MEHRGADQLCSYREADLHLCFSHMQNDAALIMIEHSSRLVLLMGQSSSSSSSSLAFRFNVQVKKQNPPPGS